VKESIHFKVPGSQTRRTFSNELTRMTNRPWLGHKEFDCKRQTQEIKAGREDPICKGTRIYSATADRL
jgi:hypothetical protein